jgi:outer membrane protein OmpA-like peptidoglycan-associated protein
MDLVTQRLAMACALLAAGAANGAGFLACPVYRDTDAGRKSGCWLATDPATGIRFDVTDAANKPWVGRMVLVEGVPSGARDICGGAVLNPVQVSILEERCAEVILPPEGYPSKPSTLPQEYLLPLVMPRSPPAPPYSPQAWQVQFSFGDDRLVYQSVETTLERAMLYALASRARKVEVTGYADVAGFDVSGRHLAEPKALAKARAQMVTEALVRLGVPAATIKTTWRSDPAPITPAGPLAAAAKRRVTITLAP